MALGYPIIMGLIASLGALIPLLVFFPQTLLTSKGLVLLGGTALVIFGIVLCSVGGSRRTPSEGKSVTTSTGAFKIGLAIAILAGILSCLPNVGVAFGGNVIGAADHAGRLTGFSRKYCVGAFVYFWVCCKPCLLPVPDDRQKHSEPVLEPGDTAQSRLGRAHGPDVDRQLLSLRRGRDQTRPLGSGSGMAVVYLSLHRRREPLGLVARRVEGCARWLPGER